jgi:hypothetical protein
MAKKKKKWAQKVELDEGSLTKLGWPSGAKISKSITDGRVSYSSAISKLNFIANTNKTKNPTTARKARAIIVSLRRKHRKAHQVWNGVPFAIPRKITPKTMRLRACNVIKSHALRGSD